MTSFILARRSLAAMYVRTTMNEAPYDSDESESPERNGQTGNLLDQFMCEVEKTTDSLTTLISIAKELRQKEHYDELHRRLRNMGRSDQYNDNLTFQGMHKLFVFLASAGLRNTGDFELGTKVTGTCKLCAPTLVL